MKTRYFLLLATTLLTTLSGIVTMMPMASAAHMNIFGYHSVCSFAPLSTVICFALSAVICKARAKYRMYAFL